MKRNSIIFVLIYFCIGCHSPNKTITIKTKPLWKECSGKKYGSEFCTYIRLISHINKEFKYPLAAIENEIEGQIMAEFSVDTFGRIIGINLLNSLGSDCDEEVIRTIKTIPHFIPAIQDGKPIQIKDTLNFRVSKRQRPIEPIFKAADIPPTFIGCDSLATKTEKINCTREMTQSFFESQLKFPQKAKRKRIQGNVIIGFVVEIDGSISHSHIKRDLGYGCGEEALRIVKMMPKWNPGNQRGRNVRHIFNLSLKFK